MIKDEKILLLAFRKSQKKFFDKLKEDNQNINFIILETRKAYLFSLIDAFKNINKINFNNAVSFASDEFFAKTNLIFPKFIIKYFFIFLSYINYFRYYKLLNNSYDKVLIWNGGKFRQRIAIEICISLEIKVYYYENGLLPNKITLDNKGINYANSIPRDKVFFQNYNCNFELPNKLIPRVSKHKDKFKSNENVLPKEYVFVPFQVDYDTQIITQSPWVLNMRQLFDIIEYVSQNSTLNFIIKEHPSSGINYPDLHKRVLNLKNVTFENGYSTQELIQKSAAVITINSTVGIESLLFHKKVIVLGNAFYNIEGISYGIDNKNNLLDIINNLSNLELDSGLIDNFLKYLYYDYLVTKDENIYKEFGKFLINR